MAFINDLPAVISTQCTIFADDTGVYHPILSLVDHNQVQNDIDKLLKWSDEWLLGFNISKCKVMHIGSNNPCYEYNMNGSKIETVKEEKDLGEGLVTDKLSFYKHICSAAAKANRILGLIKKTFTYITKESFLILYKTYVRPHLEYCVQAWSPHFQKEKDVLEKVQRRATKMVPELRQLPYENRLKQLGIFTLENRRIRGDVIEVFKIINGIENVQQENFFFIKRAYRGLRGHPFVLEKQRSKYDLRKYFFFKQSSVAVEQLTTPYCFCYTCKYV